ncbi:hypothetical protein M8312_04760 [Sphingomonas sp. KRR8]|uniref:hypothetical protein n=1 Tax=Sphingomonas sp. KRR8 TaxID=2942996 RepID=UPI00202183AC|nr:hypothetical protein [Sphingomonas sp. KRR8]URD61826.1 hypothetical protein M8312_04760 [Sphingomonas sp. KRR8]
MVDEVDTRIPLDLHPGAIANLPGYEEEEVRAVLNGTERLLRTTTENLAAIHDAKAAAATDPTLTPAAALLKVDDYASARMSTVTKQWDQIASTLANNIAQYEKELSAPIIAKASQMVSGEIRSHFKSLPQSERVSAVQAAIRAGDEVTCSSLFGAPAYLSGLNEEMHREFTRLWQEKVNPLVAKRLRAVSAAHEYVERTGPLMLKEWHNAVGVIEETREDRSGRRIVVGRSTASAIRKKKASADQRFALPAN